MPIVKPPKKEKPMTPSLIGDIVLTKETDVEGITEVAKSLSKEHNKVNEALELLKTIPMSMEDLEDKLKDLANLKTEVNEIMSRINDDKVSLTFFTDNTPYDGYAAKLYSSITSDMLDWEEDPFSEDKKGYLVEFGKNGITRYAAYFNGEWWLPNLGKQRIFSFT